MNRRAAAVGALSLALFAGAAVGFALPHKPQDPEAKLASKIARENNPVKKAKLETKLGRMKMQGAFAAYDQGQFDQCWKLLDEYLALMNQAWSDLVASGRVASKKPDGFKQLDIALRESHRDLQDFESRVGFSERQAADKISSQTVALRARVLDALFPGAVLPKKKPSLAGDARPAAQPKKGPQ
jgi:hypothetical protein